jgi:hypothetical protein
MLSGSGGVGDFRGSSSRIRSEVFAVVTMKYAVFWDINPAHTSQETHYVLATEHRRLMLWKICGFHGRGYEEWRLLGCYAVWLL